MSHDEEEEEDDAGLLGGNPLLNLITVGIQELGDFEVYQDLETGRWVVGSEQAMALEGQLADAEARIAEAGAQQNTDVLAAALVGGAAGAGLGSFVPGLGTVAGALVGAVAGIGAKLLKG